MTSEGPQQFAPRGWYPDPSGNGRERWWTGTEWSSYTHRGSQSIAFDGRYTRSYWIGPNLAAGKARIFGLLGTFLLLGAIVVSIVLGSTLPPLAGAAWIELACFAACGIASVLSVVFAAIALRQAGVLGAKGLSISNLVVGSFDVLVSFVAVLIYAITIAVGGAG